jgi:hypothetical protein
VIDKEVVADVLWEEEPLRTLYIADSHACCNIEIHYMAAPRSREIVGEQQTL